MARREIDPEEKRKVQAFTMKVILAITAVLVLYVAYAVLTKNLNIVFFEILLGVFIVGYTLLTDVLEPYRLGMFRDMTIGQRTGLIKILVLDAVGVGALLYYVVGMNNEDTSGVLFPVLLYFLCMQMKRKARLEFEGVEEEEQKEQEEEEEKEEQ